MVVLRKNRSIEKGEQRLFDDIVYFFYITNKRDIAAEEIVWESNDRCNQENLIAQLKSGVHALETPLDNLESNWAYMVMASLAWNLKAWFGLSLPEKGRWASKYKIEKRAVIEMEFKTFVNAFIRSLPKLSGRAKNHLPLAILGSRFFFAASTSSRRVNVEIEVCIFVTDTLLQAGELSPEAIYEPLRPVVRQKTTNFFAARHCSICEYDSNS